MVRLLGARLLGVRIVCATSLILMLVTAMSIGAALAQSGSDGARILDENVLLHCEQQDDGALTCDYRLTRPVTNNTLGANNSLETDESAATGESFEARFGEQELPEPIFEPYPFPAAKSAVLFLIDTSDPRRANAVTAGIRHIRQILEAAASHHIFGLATFDAKLNVRAPLGSDRATLEAALAQVRASGRTTELYRNTLAAVELLGRYEASRRALILFSDGQAEDRAYFHGDVVAVARRYGVTIDGLGYPRSVSLSVALQTLRRLADDTGGRFVEGTAGFELERDYLERPFAAFDSGGQLDIDLTPAIAAGAIGAGQVVLTIGTPAGESRAVINVELPRPPSPAPPPTTPAPNPITATTTKTMTAGDTITGDVTATDEVTASDATADTTTASEPAAPALQEQRSKPRVDEATTQTQTSPAQISPAQTSPAQTSPAQISPAAHARMPSSAAVSELAAAGPTKPAPTDPGLSVSSTPVVATPVAPAHKRLITIGGFNLSLADMLTFIIVGMGIILAVLLVVLYRMVLRRRATATMIPHPQVLPQQGHHATDKPFAFLDMLAEGGRRYSVTSAAFRIGRHEDNELPIDDPSMSRHHAQIQRKRDGTFVITDLESMNGVFVNNKRVINAPLKEGDLIELGDARLRFTLMVEQTLDGDETVMVRTAMPGQYTAGRGPA